MPNYIPPICNLRIDIFVFCNKKTCWNWCTFFQYGCQEVYFYFFFVKKSCEFVLSIPPCYIILGFGPKWLTKRYANELLVVWLGITYPTVHSFYSHLRMPVFVLYNASVYKSVHPFHVKQYIHFHIYIYICIGWFFYTKEVYRRCSLHCIVVVRAHVVLGTIFKCV